MDSGKGIFSSVFQTPFYGCCQTFNRNAFLWMIILFGENTTESSKIWKLFLLKCPKILRRETFLFSLRANYVFSEMYSSQKKSVKLESFLCKDKFSQNFKFQISFQISCLTKFQSQLMTQFHKKGVKREIGVFRHQIAL